MCGISMKHSLQLRLSQHLALTPQLQQSIKLLQLSTLELDQELERFLRDNPLLERDDGVRESLPVDARERPNEPAQSVAESASSEDVVREESSSGDGDSDPFAEMPFGSERQRGDAEDEDGEYSTVAEDAPTLREHLIAQLSLVNISDRDARLVEMLIDTLNEDGYLTQDLPELIEMLPRELDVNLDDLQIALRHLQNMEPVGVGARNLGECLALQLANLPNFAVHRDHALEVVRNHLDALAARDFAKLRKALRCDDATLRVVQKLITGLNPKPGRVYSADSTRYVVPDVIVNKTRGLWVARLNQEAVPKLRLNSIYADILGRNRGGNGQQLSSQLQEAKWLIKNVQQRFETILRVSQAIIDRQRSFFEHGEIAMRPLVLREIAETLELHESTVSRVTTHKYMHTPRGIFELKYFFGSHVATDAGGEASSTAIRALIKQLVGSENSRKPFSDAQISQLLGQQGIVVARRTVAKYRESLQILPGNLRKTI
jgi:RNA polymerase sigma-54 factor